MFFFFFFAAHTQCNLTLMLFLLIKCLLSPAHKHQSHKDSQHSQGFFVVLSAHSESKGVLCDLQCVADRAGWVTVDAEDVFMIDLEPLLLGIKDLRENNQLFRHRQPA